MVALLRYALRTLATALFVCAPLTAVAAGPPQKYILAVLPSAPPVTTYSRWLPFVERLNRETGYAFQLKVYEKMSAFEQDIWTGTPDFIFASPIQTVVAHDRHGYQPLLRAADPVSISLIVRTDSPIKTVSDLSGKRIAFVGNKNLCSVFVRSMLAKQQENFTYFTEYSGSIKNVIKSVLLGKSDAGAVFNPELAGESEETRSQLRSVIQTKKIAPHPLCAHPKVPQAVRLKVKQAVLSWAATREGAELLKTVKMASPVAADYQRDYQHLEDVDVIGLTNWGR